LKAHTKLLGALLLGICLGALLHARADSGWIAFVSTHVLRPIGQIFLRSIFMIVVPMVFSALVIGVYELGRGHGLATVARRTLGFTIVLSTFSVAIGLLLANLVQPGRGLQTRTAAAPASPAVETLEAQALEVKSIGDTLVELVPRNPLEAAVRALDGEMLQLMVFAVVFGIAVSATTPADRDDNVLIRLLEQVFDACMSVVHFVMRFAPLAVFAIVFNTILTFGTGVLSSLFFFVVTVVGGLLIQQFGVYSAVLGGLAKRSPVTFFRETRHVYLYAFSTASSNATLPLALEAAERNLQLPAKISRFVLTVGATANQNGTALFEGVTVLFLAQVYALDLTIGQQVRVMFMSILAGIGTAGVPGGSLPMVLLVAQSVGIPAEGMGLILGVDRLLDMCRTAVNVSGDLVIAALVSGPTARRASDSATG
jgi:DAACS family dicarboxylate/amino acid:cation (Na+ or H+) symporter